MIRNDLHIHTIQSACGIHSLWEVCRIAAMKGMRLVNISDHASALKRQVSFGVISNPGRVPGDAVFPDGTRMKILRGIEANILEPAGSTDVPRDRLAWFDLITVGFHTCDRMRPSTDAAANTRMLEAYVQANPMDMMSHPCILPYPLEIPVVLELAREFGFALEVNNTNLRLNKSDLGRVEQLVIGAAKTGVRLMENSDGHTWTEIGENESIEALINSLGLDGDQLFLNRDDRKLDDFIQERKALRRG